MSNQLNVFFVGAVDGDLQELYLRIEKIEKDLNIVCDWVVCTGHLGTWVSPSHVPGVSARKRGTTSDFNEYFKGNKVASKQTLFVTGSQDNHKWLKKLTQDRQNLEICTNIHWLRSGNYTTIGNTDNITYIVGLGNSYSPKTYSNIYTVDRFKHFKRSEVNRACTSGKMDIFVSHSAPNGVVLNNKKAQTEGVDTIVFATQPRLIVHNGLNESATYDYFGIKALSLKVKEIVPTVVSSTKIDILDKFYN